MLLVGPRRCVVIGALEPECQIAPIDFAPFLARIEPLLGHETARKLRAEILGAPDLAGNRRVERLRPIARVCVPWNDVDTLAGALRMAVEREGPAAM